MKILIMYWDGTMGTVEVKEAYCVYDSDSQEKNGLYIVDYSDEIMLFDVTKFKAHSIIKALFENGSADLTYVQEWDFVTEE